MLIADTAFGSRENTPLSTNMAANASATAKSRQSSVGNDADSLVPLLLATVGNPTPNFKKMAAMDDAKRSQSSLEHRFRKWRQEGRQIAEKYPEHAGQTAVGTPKKPRAAPAKSTANGKAKARQADVGDEEDEADEGAHGEIDAVASNKECDKLVIPTAAHAFEPTDTAQDGAESEMTPLPAKGKAKAKKSIPANGNGTNGSKKRGSQDADAEADNEQTPAKKPKATKKGTAKVVKKPTAKAHEVEVTDEGESADADGGKAKPKAKSRAKAVNKTKPTADDDKKPQIPKWIKNVADRQASNGDKEDQEAFDPALVDCQGSDNGLTEMRFDLEV